MEKITICEFVGGTRDGEWEVAPDGNQESIVTNSTTFFDDDGTPIEAPQFTYEFSHEEEMQVTLKKKFYTVTKQQTR